MKPDLRSAAALACMLLAQCVQAAAPTPEDSVHAYYAWVLAHRSWALPSAGERVQLAKFLAPHLLQLLKEAAATEARCVKTAPKGDKPNIIEGDLFVSHYEGASEVAYGEARNEGASVFFDNQLAAIDIRFPKAHKHRAWIWKDSLELRQDNGRWLVQDVRFEQGRTLAGNLKGYIEEGVRACGQR